ncbi:MAG: UDP-glucose 4-epimerase, partial [Verrucomicrobiota bacterium]
GAANICTGRATSLLEIVQIFQGHYPSAAPHTHAAPRTGDIIHSRGDPAQAAQALDFQAQVSIADGLAELIRTG